MVNDSLRRFASAEAAAMVELLEGDGRKVLVLCIIADGDEILTLRRASRHTSRNDCRDLLQGVDRERRAISDKIEEASR